MVWVVPSGSRRVSSRSGSEFDDPAVVVDVGVMVAADGDEVVEVGVSAVAPPDGVVEFAAVVADGAARDRAAPVERA